MVSERGAEGSPGPEGGGSPRLTMPKGRRMFCLHGLHEAAALFDECPSRVWVEDDGCQRRERPHHQRHVVAGQHGTIEDEWREEEEEETRLVVPGGRQTPCGAKDTHSGRVTDPHERDEHHRDEHLRSGGVLGSLPSEA